jgi:hypothetical protein
MLCELCRNIPTPVSIEGKGEKRPWEQSPPILVPTPLVGEGSGGV